MIIKRMFLEGLNVIIPSFCSAEEDVIFKVLQAEIPARRLTAMASVRELTSNFKNKLTIYDLTLRKLKSNFRAISLLDVPLAISLSISNSLEVSLSIVVRGIVADLILEKI